MELGILKDTLKKNGYSLTKARKSVYESLKGHEPQSMAQIIKNTKAADRASIYRTIALFEKLGIVHKINVGWKYKIELTDLFHEHHHHLHCQKCGVIIPLAGDKVLEDRIEQLAKNQGFSPDSHQLEIIGSCANCS